MCKKLTKFTRYIFQGSVSAFHFSLCGLLIYKKRLYVAKLSNTSHNIPQSSFYSTSLMRLLILSFYFFCCCVMKRVVYPCLDSCSWMLKCSASLFLPNRQGQEWRQAVRNSKQASPFFYQKGS